MHVRSCFIHVDNGSDHELFAADFRGHEFIGILKKAFCFLGTEFIEKRLVRGNDKLAQHCALFLALQPEIAFELLTVTYLVERIPVTTLRSL